MIQDLKARYEQDGFLTSLDILSTAEAETARERMEAFIADYHGSPEYAEWTYFKSHQIFDWIAELACHPTLLDHVSALIGPDILLWNSFIPAKPPKSTGLFAWHQDATYWPINPMANVVTLWIALTDVSQENGGMQVAPRTHTLGQLPHDRDVHKDSMLRRAQCVRYDVDGSQVVNIDLKPGQASAHHPFLIHGSAGNQSDGWRIGIGLNYISAAVAPNEGLDDMALLVRGAAPETKFHLEDMPGHDMVENAATGYQAVKELGGKRYTKA